MLKHAPTTLTSSLEDYLNHGDFELSRRQYLAQQEDVKTGKSVAAIPISTSFDRPTNSGHAAVAMSQLSLSQPEGTVPDLIDFFESPK
jgi:hypothetical protein